jgi:16S rRNA (uracil1498-N3)-methyltransferase
MPRFFVSPEQIKDDHIIITGPDVNHIARVLRLGAGDRITVLDGRGALYEAVIERAGKDEVLCAIEKRSKVDSASSLRLTLVQGIPKGDKMDLIVQKGAELGVSRVIPLISQRVVVKLEGDKSGKKRERWQRIALEAAKQCRRPDIPEVEEPAGWDQVLANLPGEALALMPWEEENALSLREVLMGNTPKEDVFVFIGPEGGFTAGEVERARARGVRPVTLGPRILRTETAGLAVVAIILYQWGDLGGQSHC